MYAKSALPERIQQQVQILVLYVITVNGHLQALVAAQAVELVVVPVLPPLLAVAVWQAMQ